MNKRVLFCAFFVLVLGLALYADHVQAKPFETSKGQTTVPDGTVPDPSTTPDGTLPPDGTIPDGTIPPTGTPGGTLPLTPTPTPPIIITPIVTGTPPGIPTPEAEPTSPGGNLPAPESIIHMSVGVNRLNAALGDVLVFAIQIDNISNGPLQELELEVDTPTNTRFVAGSSSPGWQLVSVMPAQTGDAAIAATADQLACPDGAGSNATCGITVPGLGQNGMAVINYAARLDESTPYGTSQLEFKLRVKGADFQGVLNGGIVVSIIPEQRHYLPMIMQ
ncbi:MAG: hypothetical protein R2911_07150 [Caldilineaceae bacterium]